MPRCGGQLPVPVIGLSNIDRQMKLFSTIPKGYIWPGDLHWLLAIICLQYMLSLYAHTYETPIEGKGKKLL